MNKCERKSNKKNEEEEDTDMLPQVYFHSNFNEDRLKVTKQTLSNRMIQIELKTNAQKQKLKLPEIKTKVMKTR